MIYIGKAASLRSRVRSYFQESRARDPKTDALVGHIRDLEYIVTANELEAMILESTLVKRTGPATTSSSATTSTTRSSSSPPTRSFRGWWSPGGCRRTGRRYFGPFYPATAMRETLRLVRQLFPLRTCRIKIDGTLPRPCLQYFIHRCNAPCTGWETREGYAADGEGGGAIPRGQGRHLATQLTREMEGGRRDEVRAGRGPPRPGPGAQHGARAAEDDLDRGGGPGHRGDRPPGRRCLCAALLRAQGTAARARVLLLRAARGLDAGDVLSAFIRQFYAKDVTPPPEILLSEELPEGELTAEWLAQRARGTGGAPRAPARDEAGAVAMAEENAVLALETHILRAAAAIRPCWRSSSGHSALPGPPHRIEGFDISTHQGKETVASMVVWQDGDMKKDDYKRYKIRTVTGTDDFASMHEVLTRRYGRALEGDGVLPDLVLLDGGRGQLSVGHQGARGPTEPRASGIVGSDG